MDMTWRDLHLSVNMPAQLTVNELDEKRVRFELRWNELAAAAPVFTIGWSLPLIDI